MGGRPGKPPAERPQLRGRDLHPDIAAAVRRGRTLGEVTALTVDDWQAIHTAHKAFLYQVRLIADRAERRAKETDGSVPEPTG